MDLFVLDKNLKSSSIVDVYKSLIWTDRYNEYGDFELYLPMNDEAIKDIRVDNYLQNRDSEHVMIIDTLQINSDAEDGNYLTVTGKSLESILERRIIWGLKTLKGNLQEGIKELLNECIISPSNEKRKIPNFIFEASSDPAITDLSIEAQYTGDNLYEVIKNICADRNIGFKVTLNDLNQFVFKLYAGKDRSYDQTENPYVVFSPKFDNLISSKYIESKASWKNVTLVGGEGEGTERKYTAVGNISGLNRREIFTDARDISSDDGNGQTLTSDEYTYLLRHRGKETLSENTEIVAFEGEAETTQMFRYGVDFFKGDIVQVSDEYGHETKARVTEIVTSEDEQGFLRYPTFVTIDPESLPDGYLKLNYIQSSGTQYIDTGFKPNHNTSIVMDVQNMSSSNATVWVFGCRESGGSKSKSMVIYGPPLTFRVDYNGNSGDHCYSFTSLSMLERLKVDYNKNKIRINDETHEFSSEIFSSPANLFLFNVNDGGTLGAGSSIRLHSCKIYDNDILIRNFVPCKNELDVIGLYDLVNETFYENKGTGSFTTG